MEEVKEFLKTVTDDKIEMFIASLDDRAAFATLKNLLKARQELMFQFRQVASTSFESFNQT